MYFRHTVITEDCLPGILLTLRNKRESSVYFYCIFWVFFSSLRMKERVITFQHSLFSFCSSFIFSFASLKTNVFRILEPKKRESG